MRGKRYLSGLIFSLIFLAPGCAGIKVSDQARKFNQTSLVIDLHSDTTIYIRDFGYDFSKKHLPPRFGPNLIFTHIDLPRMKQGGLDVVTLAICVHPFTNQEKGAWEKTKKSLEVLNQLVKQNPELVLARRASDIIQAYKNGKRAVLIGIEGAHHLEGKLERIDYLYEQGARYLTLAHFKSNSFAISDADPEPAFDGLSEKGKELVRRMEKLGMLIDLAHCSKATLLAVLKQTKGPIIATHTACEALNSHHRNIDDEEIRAIAQRGGVIGVIFYPKYLGGRKGLKKPDASRIVDHIDHIREVAGIDYIALGSDFDGLVSLPRGFYDVSDIAQITQVMLERGYSEEEIKKVLGENFLRVFAQVCGK